MRVGLLQVAFDPACRSLGMQRMLDAVDTAGATQPPAELLILPGGCDGNWSPVDSDPARSLSYLVREAIAWKSREWGQYIAIGFGGCGGKGRPAESYLFDPDGDQVACATTGSGEGGAGPSSQTVSWTTPVGDIVLVACDQSLATVPSLAADPQGGLVVLCLPHDVMDRGQRSQLAELCGKLAGDDHARAGGYWAVVMKGVDANGSGLSAPRSEIYDPAGRIIAAADTQGQSVVFADLPM